LLRFEQLFLYVQHFAEVRTRTANKDKDNSQLNQYLFKIPDDFPTQMQRYLLNWRFTARKLHAPSTARFRTMHQRHWIAT